MILTLNVFHLEDWEFYRPGFIEDSLAILKSDEIDNNRLLYENITVHLRNYQIYEPMLPIQDFVVVHSRMRI